MEIFISLIILVGIIVLIIFLARLADKSRLKKQIEARRGIARQIAQRHLQIIEESINIINKTKKLDTALGRFDTIFANIDKLKTLAVDYQYPEITSPSPEEIEKFYTDEKGKFIKDFVLEEVKRNIEKAKAVTRKPTKISLLDKSIMLICDGKNLLEDEDKIKELSNKENEIRLLIEQINKEG